MTKSHIFLIGCLIIVSLSYAFHTKTLKESDSVLYDRIYILEQEVLKLRAQLEVVKLEQTLLHTEPLTELERIDLAIKNASEKTNVDPALIRAVIWAESRFDPNAVSKTGEHVGLMQTSTKWLSALAEQLGVTDMRSIEGNVLVGASYLSTLIAKYDGQVGFALMANNQGAASADKTWRALGDYSDYAKSVMAKADEYRKEGW